MVFISPFIGTNSLYMLACQCLFLIINLITMFKSLSYTKLYVKEIQNEIIQINQWN